MNKRNKIQSMPIPRSRQKNLDTMSNTCQIFGNGQQPGRSRDSPALKYVDTIGSNLPVMATGTIFPGFVQVSQGVDVSQRTGNAIRVTNLFFNFNIVQINSDVVSQSRVIIFQFRPSSSLVNPIVADILETANDVQSMYKWELSAQYVICYDQVFMQSGTATVPTTSSNCGRYGEINITAAKKTLEFTGPSALGANQFYLLAISDSLVAPFPVMDYTSRLVYENV